MENQHKKQGIKRAYVRFFDFIKSLITHRAPVVTVEPAIIAPTPASDPLDISAELDAMLAELLAAPSIAPDPAPEPEPAPVVRPIATTTTPRMTEAEILAWLEAGDDDATTPAGAKTSTKFGLGNPANDQAAPASPAHGAAGCPVVSVLNPSYTFPTKPIPRTLLERIKASQSPLHHLFGTPDQPFKLSTIIPSTSWSRSSQDQKNNYTVRIAQKHKAVAFSLNLSKAREKALRASPDPVKLLATYINRAMTKRLGQALPYAFQFEFNGAGRLHVHGVVCLDRASQAELDQLKTALVLAAGKIKGREGSTQLKVVELYSADGWITYLGKTSADTIAALGTSKIMHVSAALRTLAEADWTARYTPAVARAA